jgi:hypothetical protein
LLKDGLLKANAINQCLPLSLINPMLTWSHDLYYLNKNPGWGNGYDGYAEFPKDY